MKYLLLAFLLPVSSLNAAEARLLIEPAHRAGAPFSESDLKMFCKTQEDLLLSATIAERVAKKFKTDHKPSIAVSRLPRTSILSVTVTGLAENDRKYLDALLNEFVSYKKSQHAASIAAATKALRDQIRQTDDPKVRAALKEKLLAFEIESKARAGVVRRLD